MYSGRWPEMMTWPPLTSLPRACAWMSRSCSMRISSLVLATPLKTFFAQPAARTSRRSWMANWILLQYAPRPSGERRCFRSMSLAQTCAMACLPTGRASKVWPMDKSNSTAHSTQWPSGRRSAQPPWHKVNSSMTAPMTRGESICLRKRCPISFMLANKRSLVVLRLNSSSLASYRWTSSLLGSRVVGKDSNSFWQTSKRSVLKVCGLPLSGDGNSGKADLMLKTKSA
mmetsp:Transcript_76626/g.171426  ORF Transcript_76626/g.171426 Transcript_76626/m.171426 type:complete len:228 (+) Transcript_76626:166-849(+)